MKLYSQDDSPYSAPVRAAIYAKGLDIAIEPPPGGLESDAYRAASLTGTIPCLVLDDGSPLPESAVILDYLEERFPEPALRPGTPEGRAREALIRRITEGRLLAPMVELFHALSAGHADTAKPATLAQFERGLSQLEALLADDGYAMGKQFTCADCLLAPAMMGVALWAAGLDRPGLIADHPKVAAYMPRAMAHPAIARVLGELQAAASSSGFTFD